MGMRVRRNQTRYRVEIILVTILTFALSPFATDDGYDETLVPLDYASAGQIRDDDLFKDLVCPLKKGVTMTCLMVSSPLCS